MRRFFAGLLVGLIVLTGMLPVTPHDDFGSGHAHAGAVIDFNSINQPDNTSDGQDERSVVHCDGFIHLFTTGALTSCVESAVSTHGGWSCNDALMAHITEPVTPPPIQ